MGPLFAKGSAFSSDNSRLRTPHLAGQVRASGRLRVNHRHGLSARSGMQFSQDLLNMLVGGCNGDAEPRGDLLVGARSTQLGEDFLLSSGQPASQREARAVAARSCFKPIAESKPAEVW